MYNYMIQNNVVAVGFFVAVLAVAIFLIIKYVQYVGLEKIRKDVYQYFLVAEKEFQHGEGDKKFEYVVELARQAIPKPFNMLITTALLRKTVQLWFNLCKDFLDDGKVNGTSIQ